MKTEADTTLIMLLSMAKLEQGKIPSGVLRKRWQTPLDVCLQTEEAIEHISQSKRNVDQVVFLYTDSLYMNSDSPGIELIQKYQSRGQRHRKQLTELMAKNKADIQYKILSWNDLVQSQNDYWASRNKLIRDYRMRPKFREIIQMENVNRNGIVDEIPKTKKGPRRVKMGPMPITSDMFLLEEIGVLDGLAKGYFRVDGLDPNHSVVIAYGL